MVELKLIVQCLIWVQRGRVVGLAVKEEDYGLLSVIDKEVKEVEKQK